MTTRVFRYGLLAPTSGRDLVDAQMRGAHRYANVLVEIERDRRAAIRAVMSAHGDVGSCEAHVAEALAILTAARAALKADRKDPERRELANLAREALRSARGYLKAAKAALRADDVAQAKIAAMNDSAHARLKEARAACGVYWGTYLVTEAAHDAARKSPTEPHFKRWTGDGAVAVQIQGGLSVDEATAGEDTRLRILLAPVPVPCRGGKPLPTVCLRVGSDGRSPVWASWPLVYHRPLPADGRITWAKVVRRLIAAREEWSLHVTVESEETRQGADGGAVAVDLGWRRAGTPETLRAGGWAGDDGECGELLLPERLRGALRKAEDIRSIRDTAQNEMRAALMAWRDEHLIPSEHAERWSFMAQWLSPARFAGLALYWREHRWPGDEDGFDLLEAWRKRDKHLWQYETGARRGALARRRDIYRVLAATLAGRYETLVIERINLAEMAKIPEPESTRESHPRARAQRFEVAPHELRLALVNAFRSRGGRIVTVPADGPAKVLLASYREQRGAEEVKVIARVPRFKRLREEKAARTAAAGAEA